MSALTPSDAARLEQIRRAAEPQPNNPSPISRRSHEAALAAAIGPEHQIPEHFNLHTKKDLCSRGLANVRPDRDGVQHPHASNPLHESFLTAAGRAYAERHGIPTPRRRIVIITCGSLKRADLGGRPSIPAGDLYVGGYHKSLRRTADALTAERGVVLIASALHGLIPPGFLLSPYNVRLGDPQAVTAQDVRRHSLHLGLDDTEVIFLGGRAYRSLVKAALPDCLTPLDGTAGIGYQLQLLKGWAVLEAESQRAAMWAEARRRRERESRTTRCTRCQLLHGRVDAADLLPGDAVEVDGHQLLVSGTRATENGLRVQLTGGPRGLDAMLVEPHAGVDVRRPPEAFGPMRAHLDPGGSTFDASPSHPCGCQCAHCASRRSAHGSGAAEI